MPDVQNIKGPRPGYVSVVILHLPEVTLCAVDCAHPTLAARALMLSMEACTFGEAFLFSNRTVQGPFRTVQIRSITSKTQYSAFILKELAAHVSTPFALVVQWDGYVIAPRAWRVEFLDYDYIGASWPWYSDAMRVGNGGFSLRSRRLLGLTADTSFAGSDQYNEDELICRVNRVAMEQQHGIRFAPEPIAHRFSYERATPDVPSFGFHGLFNMWRHVEDETLAEMVSELAPSIIRSREAAELLLQSVALRNFQSATALHERMLGIMTTEELKDGLRKISSNPDQAERCLTYCEDWRLRL